MQRTLVEGTYVLTRRSFLLASGATIAVAACAPTTTSTTPAASSAPSGPKKLQWGAAATVLRLDPRLAPVKAAVLPLSRNEDLSPKAKDLGAQLRKNWNIDFDDAGAIGRRYRRQDEIGTPFCITVDFDTLEDQAVTIRERDTMSQERVSLDKVEGYLAARLIGA